MKWKDSPPGFFRSFILPSFEQVSRIPTHEIPMKLTSDLDDESLECTI